MSSFTSASVHGIQSAHQHSISTSNTSTSSTSISSSSFSSSAANHNNNLQNYQQNNLHHNSNHSQFQSHQGQSPLSYSSDRHHNQHQNLVTSNNDEGRTNVIPLSPSNASSEQKYLSSSSSSGGPILPSTPHNNISTATVEHLDTITPPSSSSGFINIQGVGGREGGSPAVAATTVSSLIQLPQNPEDQSILQHQLSHQHNAAQPALQQHDLVTHSFNPHVSVHQRIAPTIQQQHHHAGGINSGHQLAAHQSGGGLIHATSTAAGRHSNPSSPLDGDEDEHTEHDTDLSDGNIPSAVDHGPSSGNGGRKRFFLGKSFYGRC